MTYNKKDIFEKEIRPLRDAFMKACAVNQIPAFTTCAVANNAANTTYDSDMISAVTNNINLCDDKIVKMANVLNNSDVVESDKTITIEM